MRLLPAVHRERLHQRAIAVCLATGVCAEQLLRRLRALAPARRRAQGASEPGALQRQHADRARPDSQELRARQCLPTEHDGGGVRTAAGLRESQPAVGHRRHARSVDRHVNHHVV